MTPHTPFNKVLNLLLSCLLYAIIEAWEQNLINYKGNMDRLEEGLFF
jgi:hypothetical protein